MMVFLFIDALDPQSCNPPIAGEDWAALATSLGELYSSQVGQRRDARPGVQIPIIYEYEYGAFTVLSTLARRNVNAFLSINKFQPSNFWAPTPFKLTS